MKPPIDLSLLGSAQKDALILQLFEMVTSLQQQVKELQSRLDLSAQPALSFEARQVFDIPPINIEVTEHRAQIKTCPCCQSRNKAAFPQTVCQPDQYGSEVQALVIYLSQYQMLPYQRLKESL